MMTRPIVLALTPLLLVLGACNSRQPFTLPAAPSGPGPQPPAPQSSITLSGTVLEHTAGGARALPNAPIRVATYGRFLEVTSDATGRYSISDVPSGPVSIAIAARSGYYAPCPNGSDVVTSDRSFDVHVVSGMLLSTAGMPASVPMLGSIWVSGGVFESTTAGHRPIAGALVKLGGDDADPRIGSTTLTDAAGRYLVCPPVPNTGTDQYGNIRVSRVGYQSASRRAFLGWDYVGVDIELIRN